MEASALRAGPRFAPRLGRFRRSVSDDQLVAGVRAGHDDAFEALFARYHPQILSFCRHMLGSREEAEDAVQHAFMAAYNDLAGSDKPIQLRPWLYTIARNHCLSVLRARREHAPIEDHEPAVEGLAPTVARREDLRALLRDLARLPDDQRAALLLSELGALSHEEIADVVGCPKGKVKALVFQARSSLAADRDAREIPCDEIREQLATLSGGSLRRAQLRRHLSDCLGCREFQAEVRRQRQAMALVLPVIPTAGLKTGLMSAVAAQAGVAGLVAGTGGAATSAGGGVGAVLAKAGVTKLLVAGAVATAGAGGTVVAIEAVDGGKAKTQAPATHPAGGTGSATGRVPGATPSGVVPARAGGEQAPGRETGGVANGRNPQGGHGRSETAPGQAGTSPGQANTAPGKAGTTPGKSGSAPGRHRTKTKGNGKGKSKGHSQGAPGAKGSPTGPGKSTPKAPKESAGGGRDRTSGPSGAGGDLGASRRVENSVGRRPSPAAE